MSWLPSKEKLYSIIPSIISIVVTGYVVYRINNIDRKLVAIRTRQITDYDKLSTISSNQKINDSDHKLDITRTQQMTDYDKLSTTYSNQKPNNNAHYLIHYNGGKIGVGNEF